MYVEIFDSAEEFKAFLERNDYLIKVFSIIEFKREIILSFEVSIKGASRPRR